jgi:hypothetical protein
MRAMIKNEAELQTFTNELRSTLTPKVRASLSALLSKEAPLSQSEVSQVAALLLSFENTQAMVQHYRSDRLYDRYHYTYNTRQDKRVGDVYARVGEAPSEIDVIATAALPFQPGRQSDRLRIYLSSDAPVGKDAMNDLRKVHPERLLVDNTLCGISMSFNTDRSFSTLDLSSAMDRDLALDMGSILRDRFNNPSPLAQCENELLDAELLAVSYSDVHYFTLADKVTEQKSLIIYLLGLSLMESAISPSLYSEDIKSFITQFDIVGNEAKVDFYLPSVEHYFTAFWSLPLGVLLLQATPDNNIPKKLIAMAGVNVKLGDPRLLPFLDKTTTDG